MSKIAMVWKQLRAVPLVGMLIALFAVPGWCETCTSGSDLDAATRSAVEQSAKRLLSLAAQGDVFNLKQSAVPSISQNFGGIEQAVVDNKANLAAGQAVIRDTYVLDATGGTGTLPRAEFFCGVFNTPDRVAFQFNNLPSGKYGIVIQDVHGPSPVVLSLVLQEMAGAWKLAGFYAKPLESNGHGGKWYWDQAKQYAAKGQKHNAWLYFLEARELMAPLPFMTSGALDKLYDDTQAANPGDLPLQGPVSITGGDGKTYRITAFFPIGEKDRFLLIVRHEVQNAGDTAAALQANMAVIKAVVTKWPELRDAVTAIVARAQDSAGHDYGSLLNVNEIK